ncbi:MAG: hypothetical protein ACYTXT_33925 [Nostoc sp.]
MQARRTVTVLLLVLTRMVSPSPTLTIVAVRLLANTGNDIELQAER